MKCFRNLLVLSVLLASQAYAVTAQQTYLAAASSNPKVAEWLKKDGSAQHLKAVQTRLAVVQQARRDKLKAIQAKVPHLKAAFSKNDSLINFVNLQINDAVSLLDSAESTPDAMLYALQNMRHLAVLAANAATSSADKEQMDQEFQLYKELVKWAQFASVIDGDKELTGGNIVLSFGTGSAKTTAWTRHLPVIDSQSLGIAELDVKSGQAAEQAITSIDDALETVNAYQDGVSAGGLTNIEIMLIEKPYNLYTNYSLISEMFLLAISSSNGSLTEQERRLLNVEFEYLVNELQNLQSDYVADYGSIATGGGKITLQVSNSASMEIELPVTDPGLLGIDKLDISTVAGANEAWHALKGHLRNFVYYTTSQTA